MKDEFKLTSSEIENANKRLSMSFKKRAEHAKTQIAKLLFELMEKKETNLVVAADQEFEDEGEVFKFAKDMGPEIIGLKFHPRIYQRDLGWYWYDSDGELFEIAKENEFVVINDTKLGDIGKIEIKQAREDLRNAHLVTTHEVQGFHALKAINDIAQQLYEEDGIPRGAISLLYMTSEGHHFGPIFEDLIEDANKYCAAGGVVAGSSPNALQYACGKLDLGILIFSPGIKIKGKKGERGQTYGHPFNAVTHGTDIIIVGSGIYGSSDPVKAAREYRKEGWEGYLERLK